MTFIDTHSHLFLEEFANDLPEVIDRAKSSGVSKIFMPNIDNSTIAPMLQVVEQYKDYCYPMMGLHPTSVNTDYKNELLQMKPLLEDINSYVAVGEIGIDLYWDKTYLKEQLEAFDIQIQWALEYDLPIVIHSRESFDEVYTVLKRYSATNLSGVFHSFTGTLDEALKLLEFGSFKLGINGVVTFKKSTLPDVLKHVPLGKIVLETDSPYLTPVPNRGRRNESANIKDTLKKVAEIYQKEVEIIAKMTTDNALDLFKMKK